MINKQNNPSNTNNYPRLIYYPYLRYGLQSTNTWWTCSIEHIGVQEGRDKPSVAKKPNYCELARELTNHEATEYSKMLNGGGKCIQYNGTDIRITHAYNSGYSLVLDRDLGNNIFTCGVLIGQMSGYADNPSKIGDHIYITKEDGEKYLALNRVGCTKWVEYNSITQTISIVDIPPKPIPEPIENKQPLWISAKPLYDKTLATYGSGYLWNKLTKAQQKELSAYLDALDAIINDETHSATELPNKPDFLP